MFRLPLPGPLPEGEGIVSTGLSLRINLVHFRHHPDSRYTLVQGLWNHGVESWGQCGIMGSGIMGSVYLIDSIETFQAHCPLDLTSRVLCAMPRTVRSASICLRNGFMMLSCVCKGISPMTAWHRHTNAAATAETHLRRRSKHQKLRINSRGWRYSPPRKRFSSTVS